MSERAGFTIIVLWSAVVLFVAYHEQVHAQEPKPVVVWDGGSFSFTGQSNIGLYCDGSGFKGPMKNCHLTPGTTLDDLGNAIFQEQKRQQEAYATMSKRYFRCAGVLKP
jgi:hypothetical protein